jgi:hypothetical protein
MSRRLIGSGLVKGMEPTGASLAPDIAEENDLVEETGGTTKNPFLSIGTSSPLLVDSEGLFPSVKEGVVVLLLSVSR